jgi:hypothetical protein
VAVSSKRGNSPRQQVEKLGTRAGRTEHVREAPVIALDQRGADLAPDAGALVEELELRGAAAEDPAQVVLGHLAQPRAVRDRHALGERPLQAEVHPVGVCQGAAVVDDLPPLACGEVGEREVDAGRRQDEVDDPVLVELERERQDERRRRQLLVRHPAGMLGEAIEIDRDVARRLDDRPDGIECTGWGIRAFDHNRAGTMDGWP